MTPAQVLRVELEGLRDRGAPFDWAWRVALPVAVACAQAGSDEDREWVPILEGTHRAWRAGYERLDEQQTLELAERRCEWCGGSIEHLRSIARFCDSDCYNAQLRARRREKLGTPRVCGNCGGSMVGRRADARGCSTACAHKLTLLERREREGKPPPLENCVVCGGSLEGKNVDAEYCSRRCIRVRERERYREPVAA